MLRRAHQCFRPLIVGSRVVSGAERLLECHLLEGGVRDFVRQLELLVNRQADGARQVELVFLELVFGGDQPLLVGAQLDFASKNVNGWDDPRFLHVYGAIIDRLGRLDLGADRLDSALGSDSPKVKLFHHQHHQVTRVLVGEFRRFHLLRRSLRLVQRFPIEDGLGQKGPRVENTEWSDQGGEARQARESKSREVQLLARFGGLGGEVREHVRERFHPRPARPPRVLVGKHQRQVVFQPPVNRLR